MNGIDFLTISNRGRMALYLCCAEQALIYEGLTAPVHPRWQYVLDEFWGMLGETDWEIIEEFLAIMCPSTGTFNVATYEEYTTDFEGFYYSSLKSEVEFNEIKLIYNSGSLACHYLDIMDMYLADGMYAGESPEITIQAVDQALAFINTHNLSLPPLENFQNCVRNGQFKWGDPITRDFIFNGPAV